MSSPKENQNTKIDESLYSRQLYVLGHEAMSRMAKSHVLIVGLGGLGVEIAKNVILAGVKSVTLYDNEPTKLEDLSTQFYLSEADIGYPRASRSIEKLQSLNQYVPVSLLEGDLTEEVIKNYQAVVVTENLLSKQIEINRWTRNHDIKFISAEIKGLFGMAFNDFGDNFICIDPTGNQPKSGMIASITNDENGVVTTLEDNRHGLEDGDYVKFSEVQGMDILNNGEPMRIKYLGPYTFSIGDTSSLPTYKTGGIFTQVIPPKQINFKSLEESINDPQFGIIDFSKFDRPSQLHIGFQALHKFIESNNGQLPRPRNEQDANAVLNLAKELANSSKEDITLNDVIIKELAYQSRGAFIPMAAIFGGIVAQEVLKSVSGKFHPIHQYFYFDALEALPKNFPPTEANVQPINSRYDSQIALFGQDFQRLIADSKQFLVGAGAIGCEMLKNWALIGLGTGKEGVVHITDMDTIEKSNLNRQFLFRPSDVGNLKSETAARATSAMNPDMEGKIIAHSDRVGQETEHIYDDSFFESLNFVTNALDNVEARTYMDRRCVYYRRPLLESGTLGTLGNTQVVVPHLTESYSSSQDPPEKSIPICTLKNFPNKIEHTIQWARDLFEGKFKQIIDNAQLYLNSPQDFIKKTLNQGGSPKEILDQVNDALTVSLPKSFEDCIQYARFLFEELFNNTIQQLLFNFPVDSVTSSGALFWSGPKRAPTPITFDAEDELHLNFIVAAANLHAFNYGIPSSRNYEKIKEFAKTVTIPEFSPKAGVKIQVNENEPLPQDNDIGMGDSDLDQLVNNMPNIANLNNTVLNPSDFEKDDDSNFHIDFVTACSNLRARNYGINEADRHTTKGIAGKIIPAIATTTALVTGLVCIEMIKLIDHIAAKNPSGQKKARTVEDFNNSFINLATPFIGTSDPIQVPKKKYLDNEFTLWDRFDVENLTIQELIDYFTDTHQLEINIISSGASILYCDFIPKSSTPERKNLKISEAIELVTKKAIPNHTKYIVVEVSVSDLDGNEVEEIPYLRVKIRN